MESLTTKFIGFIYLTKNIKNNKIYIGQRRFSNNKRKDYNYLGSGVLITKSIKKYGRHCFERVTLKLCTTLEELNNYEIHFIQLYNSCDPQIGYNLYPGGCFSKLRSDEFKKQMSYIKQKQYSDNMVKRSRLNHTIETRTRLSEIAKERFSDKTNHPNYGKKSSEETIEKLRHAATGKKASDSTRHKMSISHTGKKLGSDYATPEWRSKQSEIQKSVVRVNTKTTYVLDDSYNLLYMGSTNSVCLTFSLNKGTLKDKLKKNNIIEYKGYIITRDLKAIEKWDGVLPTMTGNTVPFVNIK